MTTLDNFLTILKKYSAPWLHFSCSHSPVLTVSSARHLVLLSLKSLNNYCKISLPITLSYSCRVFFIPSIFILNCPPSDSHAFLPLIPPFPSCISLCQRIQTFVVWGFALLFFQHMWYQTDLHGCDKANSPRSLLDRLIWTNSQIAFQIESTFGCGQPLLIKIWISDQQWGQNNAWATTLVTASSWEARQMFRLCQRLHQCGCLCDISAHDVAGMFCYRMVEGWGSVSLPRAECTYRA